MPATQLAHFISFKWIFFKSIGFESTEGYLVHWLRPPVVSLRGNKCYFLWMAFSRQNWLYFRCASTTKEYTLFELLLFCVVFLDFRVFLRNHGVFFLKSLFLLALSLTHNGSILHFAANFSFHRRRSASLSLAIRPNWRFNSIGLLAFDCVFAILRLWGRDFFRQLWNQMNIAIKSRRCAATGRESFSLFPFAIHVRFSSFNLSIFFICPINGFHWKTLLRKTHESSLKMMFALGCGFYQTFLLHSVRALLSEQCGACVAGRSFRT